MAQKLTGQRISYFLFLRMRHTDLFDNICADWLLTPLSVPTPNVPTNLDCILFIPRLHYIAPNGLSSIHLALPTLFLSSHPLPCTPLTSTELATTADDPRSRT